MAAGLSRVYSPPGSVAVHVGGEEKLMSAADLPDASNNIVLPASIVEWLQSR